MGSRIHGRAVTGVEVKMDKAVKNAQAVASRNVVGMLEGSDPALKNPYVIVTAHYDHVGVLNGLIYRGADDNGSGTIGVMQIARAFVEGKVRPKRSILFTVFEAEERGLLGGGLLRGTSDCAAGADGGEFEHGHDRAQ